MKYTVYKTTNLVNGKTYIGVHKTDNPHDSYLGSGKALKQALKKYGKDNFIKEILHVYDCINKAYQKEKELVNESVVADPSNYNLVCGGSISVSSRPTKVLKGEEHPMYGKSLPEETKQKISKLSKARNKAKRQSKTGHAPLKVG